MSDSSNGITLTEEVVKNILTGAGDSIAGRIISNMSDRKEISFSSNAIQGAKFRPAVDVLKPVSKALGIATIASTGIDIYADF
ncbi:hypothetical protein [Paenibacillus mesotrionivorans]|uniref:Uncharacterized protein n=1 Tax=Paenibacillus mesotrionivorans TaxID=3160968 RepID=A0ACC7P5Y0_9BACL